MGDSMNNTTSTHARALDAMPGKLKRGQTLASTSAGYRRMLLAAQAIYDAAEPIDVYEVARVTGLSAQSARRALHKAAALRIVRDLAGSGPTGHIRRERHKYARGGRPLSDALVDEMPTYRLLRSPFAVAAGCVSPIESQGGRVHLMEDDEVWA